MQCTKIKFAIGDFFSIRYYILDKLCRLLTLLTRSSDYCVFYRTETGLNQKKKDVTIQLQLSKKLNDVSSTWYHTGRRSDVEMAIFIHYFSKSEIRLFFDTDHVCIHKSIS